MMPKMPAGLTPYRRTPTFTADSIPPALLEAHSTKAGVWGRIVVRAGRLRYELLDSGEAFELGPGDAGIIAPQLSHRVVPVGPVEFHLEFLR